MNVLSASHIFLTTQPVIGQMMGQMVIPGMIVAAIAIVILIAFIYLMGGVINISLGKRKASAPPAPPASKIPEPAAVSPDANVTESPLPAAAQVDVIPAQAAVSPDSVTIAVISAAIASMMEVPHTIASISPSGEAVLAMPANAMSQPAAAAVKKRERPVWGFAGMQQNTKPF